MIRVILPLMLTAMLLLSLPAQAQAVPPDLEARDSEAWNDPAGADVWTDAFRPMPLHEAAAKVTVRYEGRLIAARTTPPTPGERDMGADLVYHFRLLTPGRMALDIRMDARDGRFLDVTGRGQMQARRAPATERP
ncbi:PepSY domain-containing protein [Paracoccus sp. NSM]|uniref:PepSY domain-containing protein n=1 Tax=Paracoccus sp. NSM TaxID=3457784 RepID=UPI004035EF62